MRYVSPANPRGTPPPPRPQRPKSDDLVTQLLHDMDQASKLGVSLRAGDLRVYGSDGNRTAFEAMVEAGQRIQQMNQLVLTVTGLIPGPLGIFSHGLQLLAALAEGHGGTALEMGVGMIARMNPCGRALLLRGIVKTAAVVSGTISGYRSIDAWYRGDYLTAGLSALGVVSSVSTLLKACFAAGTKLLTKRGWICIEDLQVGDEVWSKPEGEPQHPGGWKLVEELFQRTGRVWHLHVGGEVIRTTGEHPFYVQGKGWTDACSLQPGDLLCSRDGSTVAVEECCDTEEYETVYNCRVADWHTYFVGDEGWSFDVWAHNAYSYPTNANGTPLDYKGRKAHRMMVEQSRWTRRGDKHLKAKSEADAERMSAPRGAASQYNPGVNNRSIERLAARHGYVELGAGTKTITYFYYNTGKVVGYDGGRSTT